MQIHGQNEKIFLSWESDGIESIWIKAASSLFFGKSDGCCLEGRVSGELPGNVFMVSGLVIYSLVYEGNLFGLCSPKILCSSIWNSHIYSALEEFLTCVQPFAIWIILSCVWPQEWLSFYRWVTEFRDQMTFSRSHCHEMRVEFFFFFLQPVLFPYSTHL